MVDKMLNCSKNKYNNIAIALIVLGVLVNSCGTALAESSEPFPDEEWNRTYNVPVVDDTHWIEQTSDGGYLIAGSTENFTTGSLNTWIRKMNAEGIDQWKKDFREARPSRQFFGGNNITDRYNEADISVRETPDGGFLILGKTNHCQDCTIEKEGPMDIWLMKIDSSGNEEWNRLFKKKGIRPYLVFGFVLGENGALAQTKDGGYVIAGLNRSDDSEFKTLYEAWLRETGSGREHRVAEKG
jgi:hypothetical protein